MGSHLDTLQDIRVYSDEPQRRSGDIQYEVDATHDQEDSVESAPNPAVDDFVNEEEQTGDIEDIKILVVTFNCKNIITNYTVKEELVSTCTYTFLLVQKHWQFH